MKVVSEGVETQRQLEFLRQFGCDYVHGYLFSKPQPLERNLPLARQMNERAPNTHWAALPPSPTLGPDIQLSEPPDILADLSD
ncbi:EAL domain-containing protein, partial [Pseudomonas syringae group genomosp. 7]|uniref:EAL domain-containing protein n=1 Tax=Pseudomonas syringae group genomosp. 7 TaxID=251699 RepID=UPI0037700B36